jgi:hypothetical protein
MNAASYRLSTPHELERVVEPLVNYICAADKPKTALFSALAALCRQVDATNGAASAHSRRFAESR